MSWQTSYSVVPSGMQPTPLVIQPLTALYALPQPADYQPPSKRSRRRARTLFEPAALERLTEVFEDEPYPDVSLRESLAEELGVQEARIHTWFQNKRNRTRRTLRLDCSPGKLAPAKHSSMTPTRPAKRHAAEPVPPPRAEPQAALGGPGVPAPLNLSTKPRPAAQQPALFRPWTTSPPASLASPAASPGDSGISSDDSHFISPPPVQRKVAVGGTPLIKRRVNKAMFTAPGRIPLPSPGPSPLDIFSPLYPSPLYSPYLGSSPFTPGLFDGVFQFPMLSGMPTTEMASRTYPQGPTSTTPEVVSEPEADTTCEEASDLESAVDVS